MCPGTKVRCDRTRSDTQVLWDSRSNCQAVDEDTCCPSGNHQAMTDQQLRKGTAGRAPRAGLAWTRGMDDGPLSFPADKA